MTQTPPTPDALRATVREKYASVARGEVLSCCGPGSHSGPASGPASASSSCCGTDDSDQVIDMIGDAYAGVDGYVADADLKLGCGLPVEHAGLASGQTVLDLGAGAGLDAFVARRIVGDEGRVLGVDFTPEMVERARANAASLGYDNVHFEHGDIEALPFADASVDVVISNCVLNLVPDKARAFREMHRVLRAGGHFCVSDIVSIGELPEAVRASAELHAGCVAGAVEREEYLGLLRAAGFDEVEVVVDTAVSLPPGLLPDGAGSPLRSVTVRGVVRPTSGEAAGQTASEASRKTTRDAVGVASLAIYEPAMCCSTGVCGPEPDETLIRFGADLDALAGQGIRIERFNLGQQPEAFVAQPVVREALHTRGMSALPLVLREGEVVASGTYPSRDELRDLLP